MTRAAFPLWVYVAVAALIAATAFVVAQARPGAGMIVVLAGTGLWVAYTIGRSWRGRNS